MVPILLHNLGSAIWIAVVVFFSRRIPPIRRLLTFCNLAARRRLGNAFVPASGVQPIRRGFPRATLCAEGNVSVHRRASSNGSKNKGAREITSVMRRRLPLTSLTAATTCQRRCIATRQKIPVGNIPWNLARLPLLHHPRRDAQVLATPAHGALLAARLLPPTR